MRGYFSENNMEFEDIKLVKNIAFTTGGPRFPISHALRFVSPPHKKGSHAFCPPRNDNLGGEGGSPPFFVVAKSYFFCYLERHAKIQNYKLMWENEELMMDR